MKDELILFSETKTNNINTITQKKNQNSSM